LSLLLFLILLFNFPIRFIKAVKRLRAVVGRAAGSGFLRHCLDGDEATVNLGEVALLALTLVAVPLGKLGEVVDGDFVMEGIQSTGIVNGEKLFAGVAFRLAVLDPAEGSKTKVDENALHVPPTAVGATLKVDVLLHVVETEEEILDIEYLPEAGEECLLRDFTKKPLLFLDELVDQEL
jgi:hypothetical protein